MKPKSITIFSQEEVLVQVMSEACEVGHAASKCHQFGFHHEHEGYGHNGKVLSAEIGDLLGACDLLPIDWDIVTQFRVLKRFKMDRVKREIEKEKQQQRGHRNQKPEEQP